MYFETCKIRRYLGKDPNDKSLFENEDIISQYVCTNKDYNKIDYDNCYKCTTTMLKDDNLFWWKEYGQYQKQIIVCAASLCKDGTMILSIRHMDSIVRETYKKIYGTTNNLQSIFQGFTDQFGNFLTRKEAINIVIKNEQVIRSTNFIGDELYSENLY